MKVNIRGFLSGLVFFLSEIIVLAYFNQYWIRCKPCLATQDCPICISQQQVYALWVGGAIAIIYLGFLSLRIIQKNKKLSSDQDS